MPATPSRHVRLTDAEWSQLAELGQRLGPAKPLNPSDVIRFLIRRAWEPEAPKHAAAETTHRNRSRKGQ